MPTGAITLGEIAARTAMLDARCSRCSRHGRLSLTRLIERHGPGAGVRDATRAVGADCPNRGGPVYEACDLHFPELRAWFMPAVSGKSGKR